MSLECNILYPLYDSEKEMLVLSKSIGIASRKAGFHNSKIAYPQIPKI